MQSPLPQEGMTMQEIISIWAADHAPAVRSQQRLGQLPDSTHGLHGYTRDAYNEIQPLFPRLPNPILIMYVFPHLSPEGVPIPGYATPYPLYQQPHYALPEEYEHVP